jgi:hypothetical protein
MEPEISERFDGIGIEVRKIIWAVTFWIPGELWMC